MKNKKDYSNFSLDQLTSELKELSKKKYDFRLKKSVGQLKETHLISQNKKEIARIKQIISRKVHEQ